MRTLHPLSRPVLWIQSIATSSNSLLETAWCIRISRRIRSEDYVNRQPVCCRCLGRIVTPTLSANSTSSPHKHSILSATTTRRSGSSTTIKPAETERSLDLIGFRSILVNSPSFLKLGLWRRVAQWLGLPSSFRIVAVLLRAPFITDYQFLYNRYTT